MVRVVVLRVVVVVRSGTVVVVLGATARCATGRATLVDLREVVEVRACVVALVAVLFRVAVGFRVPVEVLVLEVLRADAAAWAGADFFVPAAVCPVFFVPGPFAAWEGLVEAVPCLVAFTEGAADVPAGDFFSRFWSAADTRQLIVASRAASRSSLRTTSPAGTSSAVPEGMTAVLVTGEGWAPCTCPAQPARPARMTARPPIAATTRWEVVSIFRSPDEILTSPESHWTGDAGALRAWMPADHQLFQ